MTMEWILPVMIVLFVLGLHVLLERYDVRWSAQISEMERRNAELLERIRARRMSNSALDPTVL